MFIPMRPDPKRSIALRTAGNAYLSIMVRSIMDGGQVSSWDMNQKIDKFALRFHQQLSELEKHGFITRFRQMNRHPSDGRMHREVIITPGPEFDKLAKLVRSADEIGGFFEHRSPGRTRSLTKPKTKRKAIQEV